MGIRMLTINVNGYGIQAKYREEDIKTVFMHFFNMSYSFKRNQEKKTHSLSGSSLLQQKSTLAIALCQFTRELGCG